MATLSVLDLAPVVRGGDMARALREARALACHAERLGYARYWLGEHHNMPGLACAATAVMIAHVGAVTAHIRVGAGGVMLPNHAPLVVAEQFGTLDALYPGRIDLGLGRAPGTDPLTVRALRRNVHEAEHFPDALAELLGYLRPPSHEALVRALPGEGACVELWILGSSLMGARVAALHGLPFAFASHFAPAMCARALEVYRCFFRPSERLTRPRVMLGVNVVAADTDAEAKLLLTSLQQEVLARRHGRREPLPPPVEGFWEQLSPDERAVLDHELAATAVGSPATVRQELTRFIERYDADELIVSTPVFELSARLRSLSLTAAAMGLDAKETVRPHPG